MFQKHIRSQAFFSKFDAFLVQPFLMSSKHLQCPFGVQGNLHDEARRAEFTDWMGWDGDGMEGWMDGMDGISKVSFKNLHTLLVYR